MNRCPFFGKCGGCKFDFAADDYRAQKQQLIKGVPVTSDPIWIAPGLRRRAEFAFLNNKFGFYESGSKNIVQINNCPALTPAINKVLPAIASLAWHGSGRVLITECINGIDVTVISPSVLRFNRELQEAVNKIPSIIRMIWDKSIVKQTAVPLINIGGRDVEYPINAFLQPSIAGEIALRDLVVNAAHGATSVADLFCGFGTFTYALKARGFDKCGIGKSRDLFKKPLSVKELSAYDCVVMDPPRAGAAAQCKELAKSTVKKIIYVSCNPETFMQDKTVLESGGYKLSALTPVDQFSGAVHWEVVGVFNK